MMIDIMWTFIKTINIKLLENLQFFPYNFQKEIMVQSIKNVKEFFTDEFINFSSSSYLIEQFESGDNYFNASVDRINSLGSTLEHKPEKLLINQFKNEMRVHAHKDLINLTSSSDFEIMRFEEKQAIDFSYFEIHFIGEPGQDAGGLTREFLTLVSDEAVNIWKLFIKSPNNQHNIGVLRDKYIPNSKTTSSSEIKAWQVLGMIMGIAMKTDEIIDLNLSCIVFKYIVGENITWTDIHSIDQHVVNLINQLENCPKDELEYLEQDFVCTLADGCFKPLLPNGNEITLNADNLDQFIELYKYERIHEFDTQLKALKSGLQLTYDVSNLKYYTAKKQEQKLLGEEKIDVAHLKSITEYDHPYHINHENVKRFWKVLESFTDEDIKDYLKFVWGRPRLKYSGSENDKHTISMQNYHLTIDDENIKGSDALPKSHTCFFELELPYYKTEKDLREKLLYAIRNCKDMGGEDGDMGWIDDNFSNDSDE